MSNDPPQPPADYSLFDQAGVAATMFYPQRDESPPPPGATEHLIPIEPGVAIAARFYVSDPSLPTVLYFHGNGEVAGDHDEIAPLYHEVGLNLFVAEFRGYGRSSGSPSVAALVADAHPVAAYFHSALNERHFSDRRFVMGRSLGAHPALELAANGACRFDGLIIESGAGNVRRMLERSGLLDTEAGSALAAAHGAKIRSIRLPALLIHGERDDLVPLSTAHALRELLTETTSTLVVISNAGHNDLLWSGRRQYFAAIADFVRETTR